MSCTLKHSDFVAVNQRANAIILQLTNYDIRDFPQYPEAFKSCEMRIKNSQGIKNQIIKGSQFGRRNQLFKLYPEKRIKIGWKLSSSEANTAIKCASHCFEVAECCTAHFHNRRNECYLALSESCPVNLENAQGWITISKNGGTCKSSPPIPENTDVSYNFSYGYSVALFTCKSFTHGVSEDSCPVSRCNDDGTWSDFKVSCGVDDCYIFTVDVNTYYGKINCTHNGSACLKWSIVNTTDKPLLDLLDIETNYCRDPKGRGRPYCYTGASEDDWEYCLVSECVIS